jgi:ferredoxin
VRLHETRGIGGKRLDLRALARTVQAGTRTYVCGPSGFIDDTEAAFADRTDVVFQAERFGEASVAAGKAFAVRLNRSGRTVAIAEETTILEALRRLDADPEASCEQGVCGACVTRVIDGEIEHRDHVLTPAEREMGDRMAICVSRGRPGGTLVLDL